MRNFIRRLNELRQYPSAVIGLAVIAVLLFVSLFAVLYIPYEEAVRLWRGGDMWMQTPRNARPVWINWFTSQRLPGTIAVDSRDFEEKRSVERLNGVSEFEFTLPFSYDYDEFPRELNIFLVSEFEDTPPHVSVTWVTPDGREYKASELSVRGRYNLRLGQDSRLQRELGRAPRRGLFMDADSEEGPLEGEYRIKVSGYLFGEEDSIEARAVVYGQVHGLAGTDHRRRDLGVALLWGTPVALVFGVLAAIGTSITTLIVAAVGVWYGGWVDSLIQRITEINLILPLLPILVMIGMFYSRSLWVMLGVVILLGIFSAAVKTYRAMFLQVKNAPYIEAARSYGASNRRLIFFYLIPKIIPTLIPNFVTAIPTYVFLEASLAVLGLGDPLLPTWGKVLNDALHQGALYMGQYYWVLQPAVLLMLTGLGFAMTGFALDRIFNPRLRRL